MATEIRPELSEKNPYWIGKHRYYELKHFCLQYPIWKKAYNALLGLSSRPNDLDIFVKSGQVRSDPTARCAESRVSFAKRMELVEQAAIGTDGDLYPYILRGVTEGLSYSKDYGKTFGLAITMDGSIVADYITTGVLNADVIRAGTLKDYGGNFSLDFESGKLTMKKGSIDIGDGNFTVDEEGNPTARRGTFAGTLAAAKGTFSGTAARSRRSTPARIRSTSGSLTSSKRGS